jgi:hypothetical protein
MNDGLGDHDDALLPEANQVEGRRLVLEGAW